MGGGPEVQHTIIKFAIEKLLCRPLPAHDTALSTEEQFAVMSHRLVLQYDRPHWCRTKPCRAGPDDAGRKAHARMLGRQGRVRVRCDGRLIGADPIKLRPRPPSRSTFRPSGLVGHCETFCNGPD